MKIFLIKIGRKRVGNVTQYSYPEGYDPREFIPLAYESQGCGDLVLSRREEYEYVIAVCSDEFANRVKDLPEFQELDYATAVVLGSAYSPRRVELSDTAVIINILTRFKDAGLLDLWFKEDLISLDERNALDYEHPEPGLGQSKDFRGRLDEILTTGR